MKILFRPASSEFIVLGNGGGYSWPADRIADLEDLPAAAVNEAYLHPEEWIDAEGVS